jgi:CheY-like chemotaxis protein
LLVGVLGNADLALADLSPVSPATVSIEKVREAATRAAELANQMLAYSGKGQFVVKTVSLSEVVQEMGHLLNAAIPKTTILKYQLDEAIPPIEADVTQIRQVVMNLITNASESLHDESGIVKLTTGVMECDETCQSEDFAAGECTEGTYAYLEVSDTGVGMDDETIDKIFDPFFTTKFTGRGLGLAAVFGIVRGHNAAIRVESKLGEGTAIRVLFLVTDKPVESTRDSGEAEAIPTVGGTVLLVDDEPTVLDVGARMLDKAGYKVKTARDGVEAVEVFKEHSQNIDCVILDLTMPRMGGEETFVELKKIRNNVPVFLSSGYNVGEVEERIFAKGFAGFIKKPYQLNELKESIANVLSE